MTDCKNLELARQWAADIDADRETLSQDTIDAAADLISSLPDAWVSADTLWKYISDWREGLATAPRGNYEAEMLDDLEALLPAPPAPRTMAEIEWDDAEHRLAEAEHSVYGKVAMMGMDGRGNIVVLMGEGLHSVTPSALTPTGRKYRLEPEDDTPASTIEDRPAPESAPPHPEDVPEFDPAYTYSDRHGDVWRYEEEEWWCYQQHYRTFRANGTPPDECGPYTRIEETP